MGFVNPIGAGFTQGRIDQGVDYLGAGPLFALGSGIITSVHNAGWPGAGTFIAIKLDDTSGPSQYVYYAEDITPAVKIGQRVTAGQVVGHATGGATGIEVGWAAPPGSGAALAHGASGATGPGQNFFNLVKSLGGIGGSGTSGNATTTGFNPLDGLSGLTSSLTGFFGQFGDMFKIFHNIIQPSFWLRIGAFFAGVVLLAFGIHALIAANNPEAHLMPSAPTIVPIPL